MLVTLAVVPFMFCAAPAGIASVRKPVGATHAGAGRLTLASGASLEIDGAEPGVTSDGATLLARLRPSDRIQICYGPPQRFADAGPTARMAIAGDLRTGDSVITVAYPPKAKP